MKKSTRIVKRIFALLLVVLMSINTLGAVVSDNDESAFITNLTSGKVIRTPIAHRFR